MPIAVIIVTHDSQKVIHKAIDALDRQTRKADQIIVVDSGSKKTDYLSRYLDRDDLTLMLEGGGIGFCRGNNAGWTRVNPDTEFVLFLNPDAFLTETFLEESERLMRQEGMEDVGAFTGPLLGYDIDKDRPSGKYDSTGIFRKWYGKWYDRGQGQSCEDRPFKHQQNLPAICGALMFCRKEALDQVILRGGEVFDNTFYMYKEDIDLSLRLRKKKWRLVFEPSIEAFHCRGWSRKRRDMPRSLRLLSARNELRIHWPTNPVLSLFSLAKYISVLLLDL